MVVYQRADRTTVACSRVSGRRRHLHDTAPEDGVRELTARHHRIARDVLAFELTYSRDLVERMIMVVDVRRGTVVHTADGLTEAGMVAQGSGSRITDLTVTAKGAAAWIVREAPAGKATLTVAVVDHQGRRELDAGADVDPGSLRISHAGVISWTRASARRTARVR